MIAGCFLDATFSMKKQFKNYTLMGASFAQTALVVCIKNMAVFFAGFIAGTIFALVSSLIIGAISSTVMVFAISNVFICMIIDLALILIISIVIPLWS